VFGCDSGSNGILIRCSVRSMNVLDIQFQFRSVPVLVSQISDRIALGPDLRSDPWNWPELDPAVGPGHDGSGSVRQHLA
jgi:hypothetical protein